jgi:hypothetical protein
MAYLLDTNVFIEAKSRYYGMDFCPAFWDWLQEQNDAGKVFSIERVAVELAAGSDELPSWAAQKGKTFFLPPDQGMLAALPTVSQWVQNQNYLQSAVNNFLQDTDYYLIAHALAYNHTIVTHEIADQSVKRVKIPNVCVGVNIKCMNTFEMLRVERARFVLDNTSRIA